MSVMFRNRILSNGLRVIAEVEPAAHSAAVGFFVRTGARDERTPLMGVSHFLEHMMFKGSEDLSAEELNKAFDQIGARNNAYTSGELTCFYAQVLPERLPRAVDLLARMLRPALRNGDFDREKGVILEEIAMYKDEPYWVLAEEATERHYRGHPLGHRVLGTAETITALSRDAMQGYFDQRYSADNTVVALAGRVDFDQACEQVRSLCHGWSATGVDRDTRVPAVGAGFFERRDKSVTRAYMIGLSPAPSRDDPRRYAAMRLAQVLGAPDNSRLHWSLLETGLAEEAQAGYEPHEGCGDFSIYASGDPDRAEEIWETILSQIRQLPDSIRDEDLERLRSKLATAVTVGGERPSDRMQRIGQLWTSSRAYRPLEEELERIGRVTVEDLRQVAHEFPFMPVTWGRLLPEATPALASQTD